MQYCMVVVLTKGNGRMYFDYSLKTLDDRMEFIKGSKVLQDALKENEKLKYFVKTDKEGESKDTMKGGYNRYFEAISTYLFRAEDVSSERYIDYSFYRDESEFRSKESDNTRFSDMISDKGSEASSDNDILDSLIGVAESEPVESIYDIGYLLKKSNYLDRLKALRLLGGLDFNQESPYMKDVIREFVSELYSRCRDEIDEHIISMTAKGMSTQDIANELSIGNTTVKRRLKRIISN